MTPSRILLAITLVLFIGVIGFAALSGRTPATPAAVVDNNVTATATDSTGSPQATTSDTGSTQTTTAAGYTMAEVAKHTNATSCWAAINGNVYDLTKWISQHPGGPDRILSICGTDGSAAFNGQHSGDARPPNELKNFLLGPLAK